MGSAPSQRGSTKEAPHVQACWICGDQVPQDQMDQHWRGVHAEVSAMMDREMKKVTKYSLVLIVVPIAIAVVLFLVFPSFSSDNSVLLILGIFILTLAIFATYILVTLNIVLPRKIEEKRLEWVARNPGYVPKKLGDLSEPKR